MHFHVPKPLHGWREFAGEVGVIVLGVLIALGAEQLVERVHWRFETATLRDSLHREIRDDLGTAAFRVMISPCLRQRIFKLDGELRNGGPVWHADAVSSPENGRWGALPIAFQVPWEFYTSGHWQTTLASGASEHMSEEERNGYSYAYRAIEDLRSYAVQENDLASRLQPLAQDQQLDDNQRLAFEADLASLDRLNVLQTLYARKFLEGSRRAGIVPRKQNLNDAFARGWTDYGQCAAPLGSTRDAFTADR